MKILEKVLIYLLKCCVLMWLAVYGYSECRVLLRIRMYRPMEHRYEFRYGA